VIGILWGYFERVRIECELALSIAALLWGGLVWTLAFEVLYVPRETGCVGRARQVRIALLVHVLLGSLLVWLESLVLQTCLSKGLLSR